MLHTTGESARPYCYTTDCIEAMLYVLLKGKSGEAYNIANEKTYISAFDMAYYVKKYLNPSIDVKVELDNTHGYAPSTKLRLSTEKLSILGWKANYGLNDILTKLTKYLRV